MKHKDSQGCKKYKRFITSIPFADVEPVYQEHHNHTDRHAKKDAGCNDPVPSDTTAAHLTDSWAALI